MLAISAYIVLSSPTATLAEQPVTSTTSRYHHVLRLTAPAILPSHPNLLFSDPVPPVQPKPQSLNLSFALPK